MARPRIGLHAYTDLIPYLERGLTESVTMNCEDENAAIRTNQRMNQLRVLQRQSTATGESPYDGLIFRRRGASIIVERRPAPAISVTDVDGNEISLDFFVPPVRITEEELAQYRHTSGDAEVEATVQRSREDGKQWLANRAAGVQGETAAEWLARREKEIAAEKDTSGHTRTTLHEIDPKKPLLDDIADE